MGLWDTFHRIATHAHLGTPSNGYWEEAGTNEVSPPLLPAEFRSLQMDSLSAIYLNEQ